MDLYNVLVQVPFATSKTKLDIYYDKLGRHVASQVVEQLKTQDLSPRHIRRWAGLHAHTSKKKKKKLKISRNQEMLEKSQIWAEK